MFYARIVIPRSRSNSLESITRSTRVSLERNVPLCRSMASTKVVFPWSTCAMMAIFRIAEFKLWLSFRMEREYVLLPLYYGFATGREFVWTFVPKPGLVTDLTVQHANVSRQHGGFF